MGYSRWNEQTPRASWLGGHARRKTAWQTDTLTSNFADGTPGALWAVMKESYHQELGGEVPRVRRWFLSLFIVLLGFTALAPSSFAATATWDGGGADAFWDTVNNWNNNVLPANGDTVSFGSAFTSGTTINLNGNRTANALTISTLSGFTITNSTLTLTSGDITRSDIAGTEADQTIASAIALGGDGT